MMKYSYTEIPEFIHPDIYREEIDKMVSLLMETEAVCSVFQVGGVSTPGISDIDLYVVFKNDRPFFINPIERLIQPANYLFTHRLFGTCKQSAILMEQFTFFRNYNLIAGENINMSDYVLSESDTTFLKHQIAIEYLVKAWISISLATTFKSIKIRNLLLHAKAIQYDIEFLGILDDDFKNVINEILDIRKNWFETAPRYEVLDAIIDEYRNGLQRSISKAIDSFCFYISPGANQIISKRVKIENGNQLNFKRSGILLPQGIANSSSNFTKLQNRLNRFTIYLPVTSSDIPEILYKRQQAINEAIQYNNSFLPGFLCTAYGMNIFEITK